MSTASRTSLTLASTLFFGAVFLVPSLAAAQYAGPVAQLVVTAQSGSGVAFPLASTVTVSATGPSLSGTPTSNSTLSYASTFGNDTKIVTMIPGTYSVSASGVSGYSFAYSSGCAGTMQGGETRTCIITPSQYPSGQATLTVYVNVAGGSYGQYSPQNFTMTVSGSSPSPATFQGSPSGTIVSLGSGSYSVSPSSIIGFIVNKSSDCSGYLNQGESRSCTVTYTYSTEYYYSPYNYYYGQQLSCYPSYQSVGAGQTATFYAAGGTGTYTWMTADRTYTNVGPTLNVVLPLVGTQNVTVSSGTQTATCAADAGGGYVPPSYTAPSYPVYPSAPGLPAQVGGGYVVPGLPNTGYEPQSGFALAFAAVLLIAAGIFILPYVRSALALIP